MAHTPRQIVDEVAAAIAAGADSARPWHEVGLPADLYESMVPELSEADAHYGFAVHAPTTDPVRCRGSIVANTAVEVVWSRVLGAQRQIEDQREAFDDEAHILGLIMASTPAGRIPIPGPISRRALSGESTGIIVGRIKVTIPHQYPTT